MLKDSILARYINTGVALLLTVGLPAIFIPNSLNLKGGAGLFPLSMSVLMLFCAIMSFYTRFRKREPIANQNPPAISFPRLILLSVILFCFIPLSNFLGFYTTNFIYIVAIFLFLTGRINVKSAMQALLVAGVFVAVEKMIFYDLLTILTPVGLLF